MFLDIAFGLFLGKYFSVNYFDNNLYIIFLGVFFALLPDLDFITNYVYDKTKNKYLKPFVHRGIIHAPTLYIFLAIISYLLNFNPLIIWMFLIGTIYHLIHDLFVLGRGVMIFYPITKYRLKFFPDNGKDGYLKEKILWWNEGEIPKYELTTSDSLHSNSWIKTWYFRPNIFLFTEISLTILFLVSYFNLT